MTDSTLLLLDGHSLAFRAFYALNAENFRTSSGIYTNAVYGFGSTLHKLVTDCSPTHVAVAFDLPGGTFRTRRYAEYKGGRKETPEEFKGQVALIQNMLDALGVKWLTKEDYEADDIVASLSRAGEDAGMRVYVASGDKDSFQLVTERCTVLYPMPRSKMAVLDPVGVEKKTGVRPERYRDMAALVGEKADNLPGVKGVGPKTTVKWLESYGSLEGILEHAEEIKGKVGESLRGSIGQVRLNYELNELVRDLELVEELDELRPSGSSSAQLEELFGKLEIGGLRTRLLEAFPPTAGDAGGVPERSEFTLEGLEIEAGSFAAWLAGHPADLYGVAVDGQRSPGRGSIETIAVATGAGAAASLARAELSAEEERAVFSWLADPCVAKVCHDEKGIGHALDGEGGPAIGGVVHDTMLEAYLLHPEQRGYELPDLCRRYLGFDLDEVAPRDTLPGLGGTVDSTAA